MAQIDEINRAIASRSLTGSIYSSRKIRGFSPGNNFPMVKYAGWDCFIVRPSEILEINGEPV